MKTCVQIPRIHIKAVHSGACRKFQHGGGEGGVGWGVERGVGWGVERGWGGGWSGGGGWGMEGVGWRVEGVGGGKARDKKIPGFDLPGSLANQRGPGSVRNCLKI